MSGIVTLVDDQIIVTIEGAELLQPLVVAAQTAADAATGQAGIATTKAGESAASAVQASINAGGDLTPRTAANSELIQEAAAKAVTIDHTIAHVDLFSSRRPGETITVFAQDGGNTRIHLCYDNTEKGFPGAGTLTRLRVRTGLVPERAMNNLTTTTGAKLQAWVVRPTATPGAVGTNLTVSLVHKLGEVALDDNQTNHVDDRTFYGYWPVNAGDMIALRVVGAGIRYGANGSASSEYAGMRSVLLSVADTSLEAFSANRTGLINGDGGFGGVTFLHDYTLIKGDTEKSGAGPNALMRLDPLGNIPPHIVRRADAPWAGKKIAFMGSSISTYTGGGTGAIKGHIPMIAEMLQCRPTYDASGGSFGLWPASGSGTAVSQYVAGTEAEFVARYGGSDPGQYSYERRIIGKQFDAVVLPDCINDTNAPGTYSIGTKGSTDLSTLWGSFSRMIEAILTDRPQCIIFLQSPAHRWANYPTPGVSPTEQANRLQFTDAMYDIANWYGLPEPLDFIRHGGCSAIKVKNGTGLIDTIHTAETNGPKVQMAQYGYGRMVNF